MKNNIKFNTLFRRATNAINLRNYCTTYVPRHGNLTTRYETDHEMPLNIDDR